MATIETAAAIFVLYANGQCDAPIATWTTQKMGKNFRISSARSHDAKWREEKERNIKSILSIDEQSMANCVSATIVLSQSEFKANGTHANLVPLISLFAAIYSSRNYSNMCWVEEWLSLHTSSDCQNFTSNWQSNGQNGLPNWMTRSARLCIQWTPHLDFVYDLVDSCAHTLDDGDQHEVDDDDKIFRSQWIRVWTRTIRNITDCEFLCVSSRLLEFFIAIILFFMDSMADETKFVYRRLLRANWNLFERHDFSAKQMTNICHDVNCLKRKKWEKYSRAAALIFIEHKNLLGSFVVERMTCILRSRHNRIYVNRAAQWAWRQSLSQDECDFLFRFISKKKTKSSRLLKRAQAYDMNDVAAVAAILAKQWPQKVELNIEFAIS